MWLGLALFYVIRLLGVLCYHFISGPFSAKQLEYQAAAAAATGGAAAGDGDRDRNNNLMDGGAGADGRV